MSRITLEVCVDRLEIALAAVGAGADRLELNARLDLDGLTPSLDLVRDLRDRTSVPLIAMVRPRAGDFMCDDTELAQMYDDVARVLDAGAHGIAFGILTPDGDIDTSRCGEIIDRAGEATVVFHRAFDVARDPMRALEQLIDLGVTRVLTSGQADSAFEGRAMLAQLVSRARGRLEILPGAGIDAGNVIEILETTGCAQVHGSFRAGVAPVRAAVDAIERGPD